MRANGGEGAKLPQMGRVCSFGRVLMSVVLVCGASGRLRGRMVRGPAGVRDLGAGCGWARAFLLLVRSVGIGSTREAMRNLGESKILFRCVERVSFASRTGAASPRFSPFVRSFSFGLSPVLFRFRCVVVVLVGLQGWHAFCSNKNNLKIN